MRSNRNVPSPWCRIQYQKRRPGLIGSPTPLPAPGDGAPHVDEFVGLIETGDTAISIEHTRYSAGRAEPGKCPKFEEFTIVRMGMVHVEHADGVIEAGAGQASHVERDQWGPLLDPSRGRRGDHRRLPAGFLPF